jgi:hypothetical protein
MRTFSTCLSSGASNGRLGGSAERKAPPMRRLRRGLSGYGGRRRQLNVSLPVLILEGAKVWCEPPLSIRKGFEAFRDAARRQPSERHNFLPRFILGKAAARRVLAERIIFHGDAVDRFA